MKEKIKGIQGSLPVNGKPVEFTAMVEDKTVGDIKKRNPHLTDEETISALDALNSVIETEVQDEAASDI